MKFLVTGGAGYIGSQFVRSSIRAGHQAVIIDNLSRGHQYNIPKDITFHKVDIRNTEAVAGVIAEFQPDTVVHFAGLALVGESSKDPLLYYQNNLEGTVNLLKAMQPHKDCALVFSSSCAVYGKPETLPITEDCLQAPLSPYGWSKKMCEQVIADSCKGWGLKAICLRYFNACGAEMDGSFGEDHDPETHLIPNVI